MTEPSPSPTDRMIGVTAGIIAAVRHLARFALRWMVDEMVCLTPSRPHEGCALVVRLDGVGDFVMGLEGSKLLRDFLCKTHQRVLLVADSAWAAWVSELGLFNEVIPLNRPRFNRDLVYRFKVGRRIRQAGASVAVQPTYSRMWESGDAVIHVCGARETIGSLGDPDAATPFERRVSNRWYTRLITSPAGPMMELGRQADFIQRLTGSEFPRLIPDLRAFQPMTLPAHFRPNAKIGEPFYVLFPGASAPAKRWPTERFAVIAERIYNHFGWSGVVCGGPGDRDVCERLCAATDAPVTNWAGRTTLAELSAVIGACRIVVSNDTAAVHIAAAVQVASICVLGGGHYGRFLPYAVPPAAARWAPVPVIHPMNCFNCGWNCIYAVPRSAPKPCIEGIAEQQVWDAVVQALSNDSRPDAVLS